MMDTLSAFADSLSISFWVTDAIKKSSFVLQQPDASSVPCYAFAKHYHIWIN